MQKARRHSEELRPLVSAWFQVLFHSSVRGSFHLSFTVLVRYRSLKCIQPYRMVPAGSHKASPTSRYSGYCQNNQHYVYGPITLYGNSFQNFQLLLIIHVTVLQPRCCLNNNGLGSSPFARHYLGNHFCFLFLRVLRCFSSPGQLPIGFTGFTCKSYLIRKSPDQRLFAPPRSLSQLITSFIAIERQGIHHAPLITFLSLHYCSDVQFIFFQYVKELHQLVTPV